MKFRSTIRVERATWEYVKKIYPVYGAKNLSAFINGLLHFFAYSTNPPEVDIRRLLTDALAGRVYVENPEIIRADQIRTDFLELVAENYEDTMLSQLCRDEDFLTHNEILRLNLMSQMEAQYEHVVTDSELNALFSMWKDTMKQNGKYREAYGQYNKDRLAAERAKMEY